MSNPLERRLAAEAILADEMSELERLRDRITFLEPEAVTLRQSVEQQRAELERLREENKHLSENIYNTSLAATNEVVRLMQQLEESTAMLLEAKIELERR